MEALQVSKFLQKLLQFDMIDKKRWLNKDVDAFLKDLYTCKYGKVPDDVWNEVMKSNLDIEPFIFESTLSDIFESNTKLYGWKHCSTEVEISECCDVPRLVQSVIDNIKYNLESEVDLDDEDFNIQLIRVNRHGAEADVDFHFSSYRGFRFFTYRMVAISMSGNTNHEFEFKLINWRFK